MIYDMEGHMAYDDPTGGCDYCDDVAPFPDSQPKEGDSYVCPHCRTVWTWRPGEQP